MQSLRQLGVGIIIAIVSVILVMGGVLLALAETFPALSTPTQIPPTLPFEFPTPTATGSPTPGLETPTTTATPTDTQTASPAPTNMLAAPTVCTPPAGWIRVFSGAGDTIYSLAQRYKTSAESLSAANCLLSAELPGGTALYVPLPWLISLPAIMVMPMVSARNSI
ncbi:MAG TPA: LysM domain-containing protein, partial [Anaerolineales bacterium]|nr:LysM domain-containing protein [Anaerolineales bacterium]